MTRSRESCQRQRYLASAKRRAANLMEIETRWMLKILKIPKSEIELLLRLSFAPSNLRCRGFS